MKAATLIVALIAVSLSTLSDAEGAAKRKHPKVRVHPPAVVTAPTNSTARRPGPSWAGPNECYTDEGYGRYLLCGSGMDM